MRATRICNSPQTGYFSPSWLATLRFTSVDKHPVRGLFEYFRAHMWEQQNVSNGC